MGEMNEKDLAQVGGGAAGKEFDRHVWFQENCGRCAKYDGCAAIARIDAMNEAERAAKQGKEYRCPYMR